MRGEMRSRRLALGLVSTLLWLTSVCAQSAQDCASQLAAVPEAITIVIDSVEFRGGAGLTPEVRARLVDDFKRLELRATSATDIDWREVLANEVRTPLQEQGYFRATVDLTSGLVRAETHRLHYWVSVQAESGPQYRLGEVKFLGASEISESELRAQLHLRRGDLFNVTKVHESLDNITQLFGRLGYIDLTVEPRFDIADDGPRIDMTLALAVGTKYRLRNVVVRGFDATTEKRLRSKFEGGQVFDSSAVGDFFTANGRDLPSGISAENSVTVIRDTKNGTIDLAFEPRGGCPVR